MRSRIAALALIVFVAMPAVVRAADCSPPTLNSADWPMYGRDYCHTFSNSGSLINRANVALLQKAWTFSTADVVSASPTVVGGVVYVGSWDGFFYALNAADGTLKWKFKVDCQSTVVPAGTGCPASPNLNRLQTVGGLIVSSAAVANGKVYFAGGKTMYCLNASDGTPCLTPNGQQWKTVVCGNPQEPNCQADSNDPTQILSSPAVFHGKIFVGYTPNGASGYRGGFVALDAVTGKVLWRFETNPNLAANGNPLPGPGKNNGCGGVWSSAAVDSVNNLVFFGTADCNSAPAPLYAETVLALGIDGSLAWSFHPTDPADENLCDFDFGASPNVIDLGGRSYLGNGRKDGAYYLLNRLPPTASGQLIWKNRVVFGGSSGGFTATTAFDGTHIFGGTAFGELGATSVCDPSNSSDTFIEDPSMHAFDAASGSVIWQQNTAYTFAASSVANRVVFDGTELSPTFRAYDAVSGQLLFSYPLPGSVSSGTTLVRDMAFLGSGNIQDGSGSGVHGFKPPPVP